VLVDGAAQPGSVLTLSHWPQSPTPAALARDLSAEIVFAFLRARAGDDIPRAVQLGRGDRRHRKVELDTAIAASGRAEVVTNDHFDEDGLVSVFTMTDPDTALSYEELLVEVASCGDFGVVRSRQAARIAFAIGPIGEEAAVPPANVAERPGSLSGPRYRAVLERVVELIEHTDRFSRYWEEGDEDLGRALDELGAGLVSVEEVLDVDLGVVTRVAGPPRASRQPSGGPGEAAGFNEVAIHSATSASRILAFDAQGCELHLRYEGWVRFVSRRVPLRPDLVPLAGELSALEPSGLAWQADGVGSLVTRMRPSGGVTDLDPGVISRTVVDYLRRAPAAWDPFRHEGALIPANEHRPAK